MMIQQVLNVHRYLKNVLKVYHPINNNVLQLCHRIVITLYIFLCFHNILLPARMTVRVAE